MTLLADCSLRVGSDDLVIAVAARYIGVPGTAPAVRAALQRTANLVHETRTRLSHMRGQSGNGRPGGWLLGEVCLDQAAVDAHRSSVPFQEIVIGTVLPLLESRTPRTYRVDIRWDPGSGGIDGS